MCTNHVWSASFYPLSQIEYSELYESCFRGRERQCETILKRNVDMDLNIRDMYGRSPLYIASKYGHVNICKMLLDRGANVHLRDTNTFTPLHSASKFNKADVCALLLKYGASINEKATSGGWTPLYLACHFGSIQACRVLLENGANVYEKITKDESTALHAAVYYNRNDICKLLIEFGSDIYKTDSYGYSPLSLAKRAIHNPELFEILVSELHFLHTFNLFLHSILDE